MTSPMFDLPEHFPMPVNADGDGPAEKDEFDHLECWCGDSSCQLYLEYVENGE